MNFKDRYSSTYAWLPPLRSPSMLRPRSDQSYLDFRRLVGRAVLKIYIIHATIFSAIGTFCHCDGHENKRMYTRPHDRPSYFAQHTSKGYTPDERRLAALRGVNTKSHTRRLPFGLTSVSERLNDQPSPVSLSFALDNHHHSRTVTSQRLAQDWYRSGPSSTTAHRAIQHLRQMIRRG